MRKRIWSKCIGGILALATMVSLVTPVYAVEDDGNVRFKQVDDAKVTASLLPEYEETEPEELYGEHEEVRVSIFVEGDSTLERGYSAYNIADNRAARNYRQRLLDNQNAVTQSIEDCLGETLDVEWNLTLAANLISANVKYGQIEEILQVEGVKDVVIEQQYYPAVVEELEGTGDVSPQMAQSIKMTGMNTVLSTGYTGAGSRVAIIDTGLRWNHQSFADDGYLYALEQNARAENKDVETYLTELDLLDSEELAKKLYLTNAYTKMNGLSAEYATFSQKVPFGFNYVDISNYITHERDKQTDHGSHVAGIAAANRYVKEADGTFSDSAEKYKVVGNAPDAQILVMKVFGAAGGGVTSDIVAACEDALVLGADSINLSLGSTLNGFTTDPAYERIMETIKASGTIMAAAASNDGHWADRVNTEAYLGSGYLYTEDVMYDRVACPGSLTNSMAVASVDNIGQVSDAFFTVSGADGTAYSALYNETTYNSQKPFTSLDNSTDGKGTEYEFVVVGGLGYPEDFAALPTGLLQGKIAVVSRGELAFYEKATNAVNAGAVATIIYNTSNESINMDLSSYYKEEPCISVTLDVGTKIKEMATLHQDESTHRTYYTGKMKVVSSLTVMDGVANSYNMSSFSSWGTTGDLSLKPEITAPGGGIYSVRGDGTSTKLYRTYSGTSMATPQVAGIIAAFKEYLRDSGLLGKFGQLFTERQLTQSLMMSTAIPMKDKDGNYYPVLQQGAGLINGAAMVGSSSLIMMNEDATEAWQDGKIKAELGDDPEKTGEYTFNFTIYNSANATQSYQLSADLFSQDYFEGPANAGSELKAYYTKKSTHNLTSTATFEKNGVVDDDGIVEVPAGQSAKITVSLRLSDEAKGWLNQYFPFGAYMQGFVFVDPLSYGDGIDEAAHSIPVLGFYGNWTDPTMFDGPSVYQGKIITNYSTVNTTDNSRMAYVENNNAIIENGEKDVPMYGKNHVTVTANGRSTYPFGGNPLVRDARYMPERDAISQNTVVKSWYYLGMRDFSSLEWGVRNLASEETLIKKEYRNKLSAGLVGSFYSKSAGAWQIASPEWRLDYTIPEQNDGDILEIYLTVFPEYYQEGGKGYGKPVGKGATLKIQGPVDDTAPVVSDITYNDDGTLSVTAADSNYVAAVVLYNRDGTEVVSYTGSKQEIEKGASATYTVDTTGSRDTEYMLQVYDYAMNPATYYMEIDASEVTYSGSILAYDLEDKTWVQLSKLSDKHPAVTKAIREYTAATSVGSTIYAIAYGNSLFKLSVDNPESPEKITDLSFTPVDLAYNAVDKCVYAVTNESKLVKIRTTDGAYSVIGTTPIKTNTLACDENGVFYSNLYDTGKIYSYTQDSIKKANLNYDFDGDGTLSEADSRALLDYVTGARREIEKLDKADLDKDGDVDTHDVQLSLGKITGRATLVADNGLRSKYMQSMEFDPNDGTLYWSSYSTEFIDDKTEVGFSVLYGFNVTTGEYTRYSDVWDQMSCLLVLDKDAGSIYEPPDGSVGLGGAEDKIYVGTNEQSSIAVACGVDNSKKAAYLASLAEQKTVTVTLTAQNDTYNALYTVTYDPALMTLTDRHGNAELGSFAESEGSVTYGCAGSVPVLRGEAVAELIFKTTSCEARAEITLLEENNAKPVTVTSVDTGSHEWSGWTVKEATCVDDGERSRVCSNCLTKETETLPADGESHKWSGWWVTVVADKNTPGKQRRSCDHCVGYDDRWVLNDGVVSSAVNTYNGTISIGESYISEARITGAGVNRVWRLGTADGSIRYMVELSAETKRDDKLHVQLAAQAMTGSGAGIAIRKNKADSILWEADELSYPLQLENGIGGMTAYSYYDETKYTELDIYFYIGEEGSATGEVTYISAPSGLQIGVWEAELTKFHWVQTANNTYEGYLWIAPELPDDAKFELEFNGVSALHLRDEKGNTINSNLRVTGLPVQLKNGNATLRLFRPAYSSNAAVTYTLHIRNHQNYAPVPVGDGTGSLNVVVGRKTFVALDQFFYDFDGDAMSFTYTVGGSGTSNTAGNPHEIEPSSVGTLMLHYTAFDGTLHSVEPFKLALNIVAVGDVDTDGDVDKDDAALLLKYLANPKTPGVFADAGDVNNDGRVGLLDYVILRRFVNGREGVTLS